MRLEKTEKILIEKLFQDSINSKKINDSQVVELERLTGDASTRRYYRLQGDRDSYVVCIDDPAALKSDSSNFLNMQKVFEDEGVRVPRVLDSNPEAGYILEEDLGNQTLLLELTKMNSCQDEYDIYEKIITQLIQVHSIETNKYSKASFTKLFFNTEKLLQEVTFANKFFGHHFLKHSIDDKRFEKIESEFKKICQKLSAQQMVLTHRDFHSRNIMIKENELVFIDFQDARMGIPQYDLASLLEDSYYQLVAENKQKLIQYYWDNFLKKNKIQSSFDEYNELYELMKMQRTYKAIGSFAYIYTIRGDIRYLKYIGFAFEKLRKTLMVFDEYKELRKNLSSIYYES